MEEAFGPYNRGQLEPMPDPMHPADKIIVLISGVVAVVVLALVFFRK